MFIDEAHSLIGTAGTSATDAANLLKPARGELRIAATTWGEYEKSILKKTVFTPAFK
ncbi:hypothetical protein ACLB1N_00505 [Escherichia coli]